MKKAIKIVGICICAFLFMGSTYKLSMWLILNEYEEVCSNYQMNVTAVPYNRCDFFFYNNLSECTTYSHNYISTDVCVEYKLVRKTDIPLLVYNFEWCEVYPDSDDCTQIQEGENK